MESDAVLVKNAVSEPAAKSPRVELPDSRAETIAALQTAAGDSDEGDLMEGVTSDAYGGQVAEPGDHIYGTLLCATQRAKAAKTRRMSWEEVQAALLNVTSHGLRDMLAEAKLARVDKVELTPLQARLLLIPAECKRYVRVREVGLATVARRPKPSSQHCALRR